MWGNAELVVVQTSSKLGDLARIVPSVALVLLALLSPPHVWAIFTSKSKFRQKYRVLTGLYADEDGEADEKSQDQYNDFWQRITLVCGSFLGALTAGLEAGLSSKNTSGQFADWEIISPWLVFATWLILLIQATNIFITISSIDRFRLGAWNALSCLILLISLVLNVLLTRYARRSQKPTNIQLGLYFGQSLIAIILSFIGVSIPRRPEVYQDGKLVDSEYTVSFLARLTFSWPARLLQYAAQNKTLTHDDIPAVSNDLRAKTLQEQWDAIGHKRRLLTHIFLAHSYAFSAQWVLQIVSAASNFLPQLVLYALLKLLEARQNGNSDPLALWLAAFGMAAAVAIGMWIESLLFYVSFLKLGVPVYEQLSAVIFTKSLRKKDVKSAAKVDQDAELAGKDPSEWNAGSDTQSIAENEDDADEEVTKTKQSTINLIGVDGKRISDFVTYNYLILGSITKLILACVFLSQLIGWRPLGCGFLVIVVVGPVNWIASKKYSEVQDELMKYRDQKMAVVSEALGGIRQIKMSAAENEWYDRILKTRRKELKYQWAAFSLDTVLISCWIFCPVIMTAVSLATYAYLHGNLEASVAFTTLAVFEGIEMSLSVLPETISEVIDAVISARRIESYLQSPEQEKKIQPGPRVAFHDAEIAWPNDEISREPDTMPFSLRNLDLEFKNSQLNIISGRTGSGKSLLLAAIVGEVDILSGSVTVPLAPSEGQRFDQKANPTNWIIPEAVAYVPQIPYIENATVRDNILFGLPYDKSRYEKVLVAGALSKDLEILQDGDMTEIGAQGINLSGGQKWRICFARAMYSRAGILILDDIFSAVDAHVGRQLFENALTGPLCEARTRILVTHHVALCLPKTDYIVFLEDGEAISGSVADLKARGYLKHILAHDVVEQAEARGVQPENEGILVDDFDTSLAKINTNLSSRSRRISSQSHIDHQTLTRLRSRVSTGAEDGTRSQARAAKKFTEVEARSIGHVTWSTYSGYIKACRGYSYWIFVTCLFTVWIVMYMSRNYWIAHWTRQYKTETDLSMLIMQAHPQRQGRVRPEAVRQDERHAQSNTLFYMGVYVGISIASWLVASIRYYSVYFASIKGSHILFERMTDKVLRAPLRWLDTTPVGRILNRFTADFNMIDSKMAGELGFMLHCMVNCLSIMIVGAFVSPVMLLFTAVLLAVMTYYARLFLSGAREVKRLESTAKSPIFEQFSAVLAGIGTIRAYGRPQAYEQLMFSKINVHTSCYFYTYAFARWMSFRANMMSALFNFFAAAVIVIRKDIDAALAGFVLSFSLDLAESVIWALREYSNVQLNFNAVERALEYSELPTEKTDGIEISAAWPTRGEIEVKNLTVSYASDLPPVLNDLSFTVKSNERVGIVGRTGAGKSSLSLALFRFLEAQAGSISIDGIDISTLKLHDLRSRLGIISQDPVLFSGTVRSNLDPFDQHTDVELRDALARAHLIDPSTTSAIHSGVATPQITSDGGSGVVTPGNKNIALGLTTRIAESGLNLSQGQRQLLCLARALLARAKCLLLDEATSSVDVETDMLIQQAIREELGGRCTLLVIAHRLSTIADFDRILVLNQGRVLEYGTPKELYETKHVKEGSFREMVDRSGEKALLEKMIYGQGDS